MSADRASFVISKPLIDATTAKIMPTSAVQLLHQSSYFDFFQTHLTLISYLRLISFELMKLLNFLRRKTFVKFFSFCFNKIILIYNLSVSNSPDLFDFDLERFISFVRVLTLKVIQQRKKIICIYICIVLKFFNLVYIFQHADVQFDRFMTIYNKLLQYIQAISLCKIIF